MGIPQEKLIKEQEYLDAERVSLDKHEYYKGEVFPLYRFEDKNGNITAMGGASFAHNKIFSNTFGTISSLLFGKKCNAFGSDLRIKIPINTLFTYPDISIICDEPKFSDDKFDTITNPSIIIEILSKSSRNYDLGEKFTLYRQIDSLNEYILIDSEQILIIHYTKNMDSSWLLNEYKNLDEYFKFSTIDIELQLADIYDNVKFI